MALALGFWFIGSLKWNLAIAEGMPLQMRRKPLQNLHKTGLSLWLSIHMHYVSKDSCVNL